jgi:hypothetical protein
MGKGEAKARNGDSEASNTFAPGANLTKQLTAHLTNFTVHFTNFIAYLTNFIALTF